MVIASTSLVLLLARLKFQIFNLRQLVSRPKLAANQVIRCLLLLVLLRLVRLVSTTSVRHLVQQLSMCRFMEVTLEILPVLFGLSKALIRLSATLVSLLLVVPIFGTMIISLLKFRVMPPLSLVNIKFKCILRAAQIVIS